MAKKTKVIMGPKYPVERRGPSYARYLQKLKRRSHWTARAFGRTQRYLTRKRGTPAQKGKVFPVGGMKAKLPKLVPSGIIRIPRVSYAMKQGKPVGIVSKSQIENKEEGMMQHSETYNTYAEADKAVTKYRIAGFKASLDLGEGREGKFTAVHWEPLVKPSKKVLTLKDEAEEEHLEHIYGPKRKVRATSKMVPAEQLPFSMLVQRTPEVQKMRTIVPTITREQHRSLKEAQNSAIKWQKLGKRATVDMGMAKLGKYVVLISG